MSVDALISRYGVSMTRYTRVDTVDAGGAPVKTYTVQAAAVLILLQPSAPAESMTNGALRELTQVNGFASMGTTLTIKDRLVSGSDTYEILGLKVSDMRASPDALAFQSMTLQLVEGQS